MTKPVSPFSQGGYRSDVWRAPENSHWPSDYEEREKPDKAYVTWRRSIRRRLARLIMQVQILRQEARR